MAADVNLKNYKNKKGCFYALPNQQGNIKKINVLRLLNIW